MSYKVFDYQCKKCKHMLTDVMIDEAKEESPKCPKCGGKTEKQVGTAWERHVSWSQWKV